MLKIKDEVDLKELEKFGFEFRDFDYVINKPYKNPKYVKEILRDEVNGFSIVVVIENRFVEVRKCRYIGYSILNDEESKKYIQILIQAGLVKKVEK